MKIENTLSFIIILLFSSNILAYNAKNSCEKLMQDGKITDAITAAKKIKNDYDKHFCLGKAYYRSDMNELAVKAFGDSEPFADLPADQMFSILYKGIAERGSGNLNKSTKTLTRGLETAKLGNSKYMQMERRFLYQLGQNNLSTGKYDDSVDYFAKSIVISANDNERAEGYDGLAMAYYANGKVGNAIEYSIKASNMYLKTGAYNEYADAQVKLSSYHLGDDKADRALKVLEKLERFAKDNGSQYYEASALIEQSLVLTKQGNEDNAKVKLNSGIAIAKKIGATNLVPK